MDDILIDSLPLNEAETVADIIQSPADAAAALETFAETTDIQPVYDELFAEYVEYMSRQEALLSSISSILYTFLFFIVFVFVCMLLWNVLKTFM